MAAEIEELDVVVGGHSHTFLWPGKHVISFDQSLKHTNENEIGPF